MLAFQNKMPDMTLAKLNDRECQPHPTRKLKGSQNLRNHIISIHYDEWEALLTKQFCNTSKQQENQL